MRLSFLKADILHCTRQNTEPSSRLDLTLSIWVFGHRMTTVKVGLLIIAEERTVIDVDTLDIFKSTYHLLKWHLKLFGLGEEVRAGREHRLWMGRRQRGSMSRLGRVRSSLILRGCRLRDGRNWTSRAQTVFEPVPGVPILSLRDASSSSSILSCECWRIRLQELLCVRSLSISRCRLNTIFDSKFFQDPLSRLLGFVSRNFSLGFLEGLRRNQYWKKSVVLVVQNLPRSWTNCGECYSSIPSYPSYL